ncbi:MAG: MBL fold metallo-hydrolase [Terriglobia bacterium]
MDYVAGVIRGTVLVVSLAVVLLSGAGPAAAEEAFEIVPVADGVYAAIGRQAAPVIIGSNAAIVVNDDHVLVVDSHLTPSAARALLGQIKTLTEKPVRYVVNTHWHGDHVQGNQAYFNVFPGGVEFVSHHTTREDIIRKAIPSLQRQRENLPQQIAQITERLAKDVDADGNPFSEEQAEQQRNRLKRLRAYLAELKQIQITLPTLTFERSLVLHKGERRIHILFFFKGHTRGDVVVYLPEEKVLVSGDLLTGGLPFPRDSYPAEWVSTLRAMAGLEFDKVIPGHGRVQQGKEHLELVASVFESLVQQVRDAVDKGLSLEDTKKAVALEEFRARVTGGDPQANRSFDQRIATTIERAYKELTGELED